MKLRKIEPKESHSPILGDSWRKVVLENALDAVVGMDQDCTIIDWNRQAEVIFGWSKSEAIGRNLTETIIPSKYRSAHIAGMKHFFATREGPILNHRIEIEGLHRNGRIFPIELTVIPLQLSSSFIFYSFLRDISVPKHTEQERERLRERLSFLSEVTKSLLADPLGFESRLQTIMKAAVPKLGDWGAIDLIQSNQEFSMVTTVHSDPKKNETIQEFRRKYPLRADDSFGSPHVIRTGISELVTNMPHERLRFLAQNENHFKLLQELNLNSYLCVPLRARGHVIGAFTLVGAESGRHFDSDDLALAEELADRAASAIDNSMLYRDAQEAIRVRDEFLSIASHELKTPLTSLKLQTQISLRRYEKNDPAFFEKHAIGKFLNTHLRQVDRLSNLVENMLDISRISLGKLFLQLEEVDIGELVRDVIDRFDEQIKATGSSYRLIVEGSVVGCWDHYRIEQVVTNLITNAMKYGEGKPIEISVTIDRDVALLKVRDQGLGIAQDNLDRIFQRFERAITVSSISGLGLGLYISKQIVEAHHGVIRVQSKLGEGSEFIVELPLIRCSNSDR